VLGVDFAQRNRAVGSTAAVLGQPLRQAQDRVTRIDPDAVRPRVERDHDAVRVIPALLEITVELFGNVTVDGSKPRFRGDIPRASSTAEELL
jgi:hypothetical protein